MVAYSAERSHSWLYIRSISHHAAPGHGGKMDHYAVGGYFRFLVMEGTFVAQAVAEGVEECKSATACRTFIIEAIQFGDSLSPNWMTRVKYVINSVQNCTA